MGKASSASLDGLGWSTDDPTEVQAVTCYAVFVGSSAGDLSENSCSSNVEPNFKFGPHSSFVAAGGRIDLDVPAGSARRIHLVGIKGTEECPTLPGLVAKPYWSRPMILATEQVDLVPGENTVSMKAALSNHRLEDCSVMQEAPPKTTIAFESATPAVSPKLASSGTQNFSVSFKGNSLTYAWALNGTLIAGQTGSSLSLNASSARFGENTLVVSVTDAYQTTATHTFTFSRNRPPTVSSFFPSVVSDLSIYAGHSFSISALDADSDTLSYNWAYSGNPALLLANFTSSTVLALSGDTTQLGPKTLSVVVSDGLDSVVHVWSLNVNAFRQSCNNLAAGQICTLVGSPTVNQGNPSTAKLSPSFMAFDAVGGLFIADSKLASTWYWNRSGVAVSRLGTFIAPNEVKIVAGTGSRRVDGSTLSGGTALHQDFYPFGDLVYDDGSGKLYVSEPTQGRVLSIDSGGAVSPVFGGGAGHTDGTSGLSHSCSGATGLALFAGNLFVSCTGGHRVKRLDLATNLGYVMIGNGSGSIGSLPISAPSSSPMPSPTSLAVTSDGIYIVSPSNNSVYFLNLSGGAKTFWSTVTVSVGEADRIIGDGSPGTPTNNSIPTGAFASPKKVFVSGDTIYASSFAGNHRIYVMNNSGAAITPIPSLTVSPFQKRQINTMNASGAVNGSISVATFGSTIDEFEIDPAFVNEIFVADAINFKLRKIDFSLASVSDAAGVGYSRSKTETAATAIVAPDMSLNAPTALKLNPVTGSFYFMDALAGRIREILPSGMVSKVMGNGVGSVATNGVLGSAVLVSTSSSVLGGIAGGFDFLPGLGIMYVNSTSHTVRFFNQQVSSVNLAGSSIPAQSVQTLFGLHGTSGTSNGTPATARFNYPGDIDINVALDEAIVVDRATHCIRRIALTSGAVTTVVGACGSSGATVGTAIATRLNLPSGLTRLPDGNYLIADRANNRVLVWGKIMAASYGSVAVAFGSVVVLVGGGGTLEMIQSNLAKCTAPSATAFDHLRNRICVSCMGEGNVRCVDPTSGTIFTVAGKPTSLASRGAPLENEYEGATATNVRLAEPSGIAFDASGFLLINDAEASLIYKVNPL